MPDRLNPKGCGEGGPKVPSGQVDEIIAATSTYELQTGVSKGQDVPRDVPGQTGTGRPVVPLSRDKKKFLSRCPFVPGQGQEQMSRDKLFCPGTSRDKITPQKPGKRRSKTEKGCSKTGKWRSKTEKEVLKQEKDVLKQKKYVPKQENMFWNRKS